MEQKLPTHWHFKTPPVPCPTNYPAFIDRGRHNARESTFQLSQITKEPLWSPKTKVVFLFIFCMLFRLWHVSILFCLNFFFLLHNPRLVFILYFIFIQVGRQRLTSFLKCVQNKPEHINLRCLWERLHCPLTQKQKQKPLQALMNY